MSKDKISDYSATANSNTDIAGINIDEGCAPSGINNAIRTLMKQLKDFQQGTNSDSFNGPVGTTTPAAGAFTTITASGTATLNGNTVIGDADTDTITQAASYVTGTQLKSAKTATNTLNLAAYDVDGAAYTNLVTLTAGDTPTLDITSTGVGSVNNMSIGSTTAAAGAFTTLSASGVTTLSAGDASAPALTTSGDTNTGVLFPAADTVAVTTGGTERVRVDSSGNVGIGTSSPTTISGYQSLTVNGSTSGLISVKYNGTDGGYIYSDSSSFNFDSKAATPNLVFKSDGSEKMRIDSSGNLKFNSGYGSVATAYGCRAWVNFNGTGTPSITGSGNVTSITDNGTGRYTINFTTAMPDTVYAAIGSCKDYDNSRSVIFNEDYSNSRTSSSFPCQIMTSSNAAYDTTIISAAFFR
jgi:hypothetical protein